MNPRFSNDRHVSSSSTQRKTPQQHPANRRVTTGGWGRLRSPTHEPLEAYGLPSKGETRLNDPKAQEAYYNKIVERYMKFCASHASAPETLADQFAAISLTPPTHQPPPSPSATPSPTTPSPELQTILHAMRKLRESLTATNRLDPFAQRAYVFITRAALLCKSYESYHPALQRLLGPIHAHVPLSDVELHEFVGYEILDLACRQGDYAAAHALRVRAGYADRRVEGVVRALVRDDWVGFWRLWRAVDGYQRGVMEWAVEGLRVHVLKCFARTYFEVEKEYLERVTGEGWEGLVKRGVGWELVKMENGREKIVIRRVKKK
ncbi:hypothetical protein P152DRAFT_507149 [Eremomyces bilateralis CBS 781.70]|uniref:CSN8/PSMD8/EIF3K domain-containing protein n=1 Tax=Eremomyces bilateralis CBS 781.70 TaxID=1392243 RepID=A0A6G1G4C2_9PEZI|nr:uncharacterized protein P152DRAFT_507149 [Eremomyces bilateralis CBS 781.70]KAF1812791.1 hypothetical protein P152DRAFT_507149 [Eremomyces bilateralis CBS 781.70]